MAQQRSGKGARRQRKKDRRQVSHGQAHIKSSFNNTIITITDQSGGVLAWSSGGIVGQKGSR